MKRSLAKFFLPSSYILTSCVQKPETRSQKETSGHPSLLCLPASCRYLSDFPRRDPKNAMSTISFSSFRLVHSFVCNNRDSIQQTINVTHSKSSNSSRNDFSFYTLIFTLHFFDKINLDGMFCSCKLLLLLLFS